MKENGGSASPRSFYQFLIFIFFQLIHPFYQRITQAVKKLRPVYFSGFQLHKCMVKSPKSTLKMLSNVLAITFNIRIVKYTPERERAYINSVNAVYCLANLKLGNSIDLLLCIGLWSWSSRYTCIRSLAMILQPYNHWEVEKIMVRFKIIGVQT